MFPYDIYIIFALSAWGAALVGIFLGHDSSFISVSLRLLGASLASPVIQGRLFAGDSLVRLIYLRLFDRMCGLEFLSNFHLLLFNGQLSLVLLLLSLGRGEEINV